MKPGSLDLKQVPLPGMSAPLPLVSFVVGGNVHGER